MEWSDFSFFSLIRSSYLDRRSVSYLSVFRQYFPDFADFQFAFCLFFCPFFGSDLILARTVSVMKNSSLKSGFALCSIRKSGNLCSFLIPEDLVRTYSLHPKRLRKILHFLLSNWDETLIRKRFLGKRLVYARYQEKNLNLQKMNFRPFEEDWCKLGILAWGLGISRCLLFSFLLEWTEKEGISSKTKSNGVPTYLVITRKLLFPRKRLQRQIQLVRAHPS